ncbi:unnamed protein product [Microthlaspi erraticum]|uniref:Uncharacterized protein n=1 Tax=Microthlaspi erraticum TaxID=1685480 RepID=A0A6D2HU08_9BRAS|nr:unnamed protein product [Microthlaspi erraticum]
MGREEQGRTWCMDAAQLDTQRKKEEVILKTSSTTYSTIRSSSSTRPAKLQLDRAEKCMRTRSSRTTKDLVELDFTTDRKRSHRTQRVQEEPEVLVTDTMDVPEGNGNPLAHSASSNFEAQSFPVVPAVFRRMFLISLLDSSTWPLVWG